jgi:hypothetical protein
VGLFSDWWDDAKLEGEWLVDSGAQLVGIDSHLATDDVATRAAAASGMTQAEKASLVAKAEAHQDASGGVIGITEQGAKDAAASVLSFGKWVAIGLGAVAVVLVVHELRTL